MCARIVVAMSGGVDSSTVAALLHSEGHEVIGITLKLYDNNNIGTKKGACCAGQDIYDAQATASKLGIPHYVLNYESLFKQKVIDNFVDQYITGYTPIPCIQCNQKVKFNDLLNVARTLGVDHMATGHYVQKVIIDNQAQLHKGLDPKKDQSYFLFTTTQEQLDFLLFPIGRLHKSETRKLASQFGLNVADKQDSQDICFVSDAGGYNALINKLRPEAHAPGEIFHIDGTPIGKHNGIVNFTVGQRKGIGIANAEPLYVIKIDDKSNKVIVGPKSALHKSTLTIADLNWIGESIQVGDSIKCTAKLRSAHEGSEASVEILEDGRAQVTLLEPYLGISPGQACVLYQNERVLGGGWIEKEQ